MAKREWLDKYRGTLKYFQYVTWNDLLKMVVNSGSTKIHKRSARLGILVLFTREEYYKWCKKNESLILAIYEHGLNPTLWRKNENKHFTFDNIFIGIKNNPSHWNVNFGPIKRKIEARAKQIKKGLK